MKAIVAKLSLLCVSLIISLILPGQSFAKIDLKTAAGIWLFDEGSGNVAKDFSGNGNDGTLMSGPKWVKGKFNNALEFDVGKYVDCGNGKSLSMGNGEFTIGAWVNPSQIGNYPMILTKGHPGIGAQKGYRLRIEASRVVQCTVTGDTEEVAGSTKTVKEGDWWHIVGVKNSEKLKLYVNGEEWGSDDAPAGTTDNDVPLQIGRENNNDWYFQGVIDDVFIFSVALSLDDIKTIMTKGFKSLSDVSPSSKLAATWAYIKAK